MRRWLVPIAVMVLTVVIGGVGFIYSGLYDIGADTPHWPLTENVIETLRNRSIARQAKEVQAPNLDDAQLVLKGAGQYDAMCVKCHLAPGMDDSDIRPGLYPQPPNLSQHQMDPKVAFWVTKHGIKMSGMPAWGVNHDDATIWSIVAFVNKLPNMNAQQYRDVVAKAAPGEGMQPSASRGHSHAGTQPHREEKH